MLITNEVSLERNFQYKQNEITQTIEIEREEIDWHPGFLAELKVRGIEIPLRFRYKKTLNDEDHGW